MLSVSCSDADYVTKEYVSQNLSPEKVKISQEVFKKIENSHYVKDFVKEDFNKNYILALIDKLDGNKQYFIKNEVDEFIEKSNTYDESDFDIDISYEIINLYFKKIVEFSEFQIELIKNTTFSFDKNESLDIYYEDNEWLDNTKALEEVWRLQTKNDFLVAKMSEDISQNPEKDLIKRYQNRIKRVNQQKEEDIFSIAMITLANQFDPHSSYLSPRSAEDFDMNMSLKLEGIGALLGLEDDHTKIVSLVAGGPAERSGKISPDDKITRIRQKDKESEYVDVVGWRIDEVVNLIRGESGTEVEIEFISSKASDSERKIVTLKREEIKLEDRAAKGDVHDLDNGSRIGIIDLPSFYIDFNAYQKRTDNYKSSSVDVKKILEDFQEDNVDGVILDLRNNGGGALIEANKIIGLFVASGPTVQVKHSSGYIQPYGDSKATQVWDKPLLILVNRYSASASEIVAAAIQDYQRGIVVGQRTFGKGTVQSLEDISKGQIKVTESKYYRVDGTSTQNKGVTPDIVLPSTWDIETLGESSYPTALAWDKVRPYRHNKFPLNYNKLKKVRQLHKDRLNIDPNLLYLSNVRQRYDENKNKRELSLNINDRVDEKDSRKLWLLKIENERRLDLGLPIYPSYEALENSEEEELVDRNNIDLENDFLLIESTKIIGDFIDLNKKIILTKVN